MDDVNTNHRRLMKRSTKPPVTDSPAYDASEEDNDPLTDESASTVPRTVHQHAAAMHRLQHTPPSSRYKHSALSAVMSDADSGVDSPTYDGDVEFSAPTATAGSDGMLTASGNDTAGSTSTLTSPARSTFGHAPVSQPANQQAIPISSGAEPLVAPIAAAQFDPAALTPEDIQEFVQSAIAGTSSIPRDYKINSPPVGRPVRIYADGVYDLLHFGHALQLRQAKLSFPSVYLLVGVNSDELVKEHKHSRTVMTHAERCETVRHCRWVDEVIQEAPWVIDQAFIDKWAIDYVAHDEDPYVSAGHDDVYKPVKDLGKFLPTRRTPGVSTSDIIERMVSGYRAREFDHKLEKLGHPELRAEGSDYDGLSREHSRVRGRKAREG